MAKSSRAYRGAKRGKELKRLRKQEDKRKRRLAKKEEDEQAPEALDSETSTIEPETPAEAPEKKEEEQQ